MVGAGSPQSRCVLRKVGEACERHDKTPGLLNRLEAVGFGHRNAIDTDRMA